MLKGGGVIPHLLPFRVIGLCQVKGRSVIGGLNASPMAVYKWVAKRGICKLKSHIIILNGGLVIDLPLDLASDLAVPDA